MLPIRKVAVAAMRLRKSDCDILFKTFSLVPTAIIVATSDIWAEILKEYGKEVKYKNYYLLPYLFVLIRRLFGRRILAALLSVYEKNSIDKFLSVISYIPRKRLKKVVNVISDELYNESIYGPEVDGGIFSHIREVVFGMNDGLVEVLAAVAGIVGIYHDNLITSFAEREER